MPSNCSSDMRVQERAARRTRVARVDDMVRNLSDVGAPAESASEGHQRVSEKPIRGVDDHFLLHQAVTPDSGNGAYAVVRAGELRRRRR